jgi:flagellum-specific ATP synthase
LEQTDPLSYKGKIDKIIGMVIESSGPRSNIGEVCTIYAPKSGRSIRAEVVGFRDEKVLLMPFEDLSGIGPGSIVESTGDVLRIPVGEQLIGKIIDGFGNPMDGTKFTGIQS